MAIFAEVTENERIIDRHLRGIHPLLDNDVSESQSMISIWFDLIELGLSALYGVMATKNWPMMQRGFSAMAELLVLNCETVTVHGLGTFFGTSRLVLVLRVCENGTSRYRLGVESLKKVERLGLISVLWLKRLVDILRGPSTEPGGTPLLTTTIQTEHCPFTTTRSNLLVKTETNHFVTTYSTTTT